MAHIDLEERRSGLKEKVLEHLHDPIKLRFVVVAAVVAIGYGAVYVPMSEQIAEKQKKIERDTHLLAVAERYEGLQKQHAVFADRITDQSDAKEWIRFIIDEMRGFSLIMSSLICEDPKPFGPYRVMTIRIDLQGSYSELDRFMRWVETNHRFLRADEVTFTPRADGAILKVTLLGLTT